MNKLGTGILCILIGAVTLTGCATSQIAKNTPEPGSPNPEAPPDFPDEMPHFRVRVAVSNSQFVSLESDFPIELATEPLAYRVTVELINPNGPPPQFSITRVFVLPPTKSHEQAVVDVYADTEERGVRLYKAWRLISGDASSPVTHFARFRGSVVSEAVEKRSGAEVRRIGTFDILMESQSPVLVAQPAKLHIHFSEGEEVVIPLLRN